jgi:hypothetical protein
VLLDRATASRAGGGPRMNMSRWSPGRLADITAEFALRARASRLPSGQATWPLPADFTKDLVIYWPKRYEWPPTERWVIPLLARFQEHARVEFVDFEPLHGDYKGVVPFEVEHRGRRSRVIIDFSDFSRVHERLAREVLVYFKMQFLKPGYGIPSIIPGGFVMGGDEGYRYLAHLRRQRDRANFRYDVYGRFSLGFARETRSAILRALEGQQRFAYEGGGQLRRYSRFLRDVSRSKVCIDVPGNGDLCYRLIDYLGVGACIISPGHVNRLNRELEPGVHIVYAKPDLSDLVELCDHYVRDARAREAICRNARDFFDRYLHRDQLGDYYLAEICTRLREQAPAGAEAS